MSFRGDKLKNVKKVGKTNYFVENKDEVILELNLKDVL